MREAEFLLKEVMVLIFYRELRNSVREALVTDESGFTFDAIDVSIAGNDSYILWTYFALRGFQTCRRY